MEMPLSRTIPLFYVLNVLSNLLLSMFVHLTNNNFVEN